MWDFQKVGLLSSKEFGCNEAKPRCLPASTVTEVVVAVVMVPATAAACCRQLRYITQVPYILRCVTFSHIPKIVVTSMHILL